MASIWNKKRVVSVTLLVVLLAQKLKAGLSRDFFPYPDQCDTEDFVFPRIIGEDLVKESSETSSNVFSSISMDAIAYSEVY